MHPIGWNPFHGAQALHLSVLVTPHQDSAFMMAIGWVVKQATV